MENESIDLFASLSGKLMQRVHDYCHGPRQTSTDLLNLLIEDYTVCFDYLLRYDQDCGNRIVLIDTAIRIMEHCQDAEVIRYAFGMYTGEIITVSAGLINKFTLKSLLLLFAHIPEQEKNGFRLRLAELFYQWGAFDRHKTDIALELIVPVLRQDLVNPAAASTSAAEPSALQLRWESRFSGHYADLLQTLVRDEAALGQEQYFGRSGGPLLHGQTLSALEPLFNFWRHYQARLEHSHAASSLWQHGLSSYPNDFHIPGLITWLESISCDEKFVLISDAIDSLESLMPIWELLSGGHGAIMQYYLALRHLLPRVRFPDSDSERVQALEGKILLRCIELSHQSPEPLRVKPTIGIAWHRYLADYHLSQQRFFEAYKDAGTVAHAQLRYSRDVIRILDAMCADLVALIDTYAAVKPPGDFVLMAMGSLARDELVPGSDFDCALLLDESLATRRAHPYFQTFIQVLKSSIFFMPGLEIDGGDLASFSPSSEVDLINTGTGYLRHYNPRVINLPIMRQYHSAHRMVPVFAYEPAQVEAQGVLGLQYRQAVAAAYTLNQQQGPVYRLVGATLLRMHSQADCYPLKTGFKDRYVSPLLYWISDVALYLGLSAADGGLILNPLEMLGQLRTKGHLDPAFASELTEAYELVQKIRANPCLASRLQAQLDTIEEHIIAPLYQHIPDVLSRATMQAFDPTVLAFEAVGRTFDTQHPEADAATSAQVMAVLKRWQKRTWTLEQVMLHISQFPFSGMQCIYRCLMQELIQPELSSAVRTYWQRLAACVAYHPDRSGERIVRQLSQETWQYKLSALLGPGLDTVPGAHDRPAGYFESGVFASGHWNMRYYRIPAGSELLACLWQNQRIKAKPNGQGGQHHALPVRVNGQHAWFKLLPEQPVIALAVNDLMWRIAGEGVPDSTVMTWVLPDGNRIAVEIIDHVAGVDLFQVLQNVSANERLRGISKRSFTGHLLRVLLTHPEDDKEDDYFLVPASSNGQEGDAHCDLMRIDTERAFFPVDATTGWFGAKQLQIKSVLCCFEAMLEPLDEPGLKAFASLSPQAVVNAWLDVLQETAVVYRHLFPEPMLEKHFAARWSLPGVRKPGFSLLTPYIPVETVSALYDRFHALHSTICFKLARGDSLTGLSLLSIVNSDLANYYSALFQMPHSSVLSRFEAVTRGLYKTVKGQRQSTLTGIRVVNTQIGYELTYEKVRLAYHGGEGSPDAAARWLKTQGKIKVKEAFWAVLSEQEGAVPLIQLLAQKQRLVLLRMVINRIQDAKSVPVRTAGSSSDAVVPVPVPHGAVGHVSARSRHLLWRGLTGTHFTALAFNHFFRALDDALVQSLLKGAGACLLELHLSGKKVSMATWTQVPLWHPCLQVLSLSHLSSDFESLNLDWPDRFGSGRQLPALTRISITHIPDLRLINFTLPSLEQAHFEQLNHLLSIHLIANNLVSLDLVACPTLQHIQLSAPRLSALKLVSCDGKQVRIIHELPKLTSLHLEKLVDSEAAGSANELLLDYFRQEPVLTHLLIRDCKNISSLAQRFFESLLTDRRLQKLLAETGVDSFKGLVSVLSRGISHFVWREAYEPRALWWALLDLGQIDSMTFEFMPNAEDQSRLNACLDRQTHLRELTLPYDVMQPAPYQEILNDYQALESGHGFTCRVALVARAAEVGESAWLSAFAKVASGLPCISGFLQPKVARRPQSKEPKLRFIPWTLPTLLQVTGLELCPRTNAVIIDRPLLAGNYRARNTEWGIGSLGDVLKTLLPRWVYHDGCGWPKLWPPAATNAANRYALASFLQKLTQTTGVRAINLSHVYGLLNSKIIADCVASVMGRHPDLSHIDYLVNPSNTACLTLRGHRGSINTLMVLPDGRVASGSADATLRLWDTGKHTSTVLEGHTTRVTGLAVLPDGRLVSGSEDNNLRLWDVDTERCLSTVTVGDFTTLAMVPDGQIAIGHHLFGVISIWDMATQKRKGVCSMLALHKRNITNLVALPDGRLVSSGSGDYLLGVWDSTPLRCITALKGHTGDITALAVFADGRVLSGSWDRTLRLWNVTSYACIAVFKGHAHGITALAIRHDGQVVSGDYNGSLRLWDMVTQSCLGVLEPHNAYDLCLMSQLPAHGEPLLRTLYLEKSGDKLGYLARTAEEGAVRGVFDIQVDGNLTIELLHDLKETLLLATLDRFPICNSQITALAFLPDGRVLSGSEAGSLCIWPAWQEVHLNTGFRNHWQRACSWHVDEAMDVVVAVTRQQGEDLEAQESLQALHRLLVTVFAGIIDATRWHHDVPAFVLKLRTHIDFNALNRHDLTRFMQALLQSSPLPAHEAPVITANAGAASSSSTGLQHALPPVVSFWTAGSPTFFSSGAKTPDAASSCSGFKAQTGSFGARRL